MSSVVSKERLLVLVFVTAEEFLWFSGFSCLSPFAPHTDSYFLSLVGSDWGRAGLQCRQLSVCGGKQTLFLKLRYIVSWFTTSY